MLWFFYIDLIACFYKDLNTIDGTIHSIIGRKPNAVDLLLKAGANLKGSDRSKRSSFHHAAIAGNCKVLDILLQHLESNKQIYMPEDSCTNKKQVNAYTIRQRFTSKNVESVIESPDKDGVRAIDLAIAHSNEEILARLLKKGAKLGPTTWAMAKGKPRIA